MTPRPVARNRRTRLPKPRSWMLLGVALFATQGVGEPRETLAEEPARAGAEEACPTKQPSDGWRDLFDGESLGRWKPVDQFDFSKHGKVAVRGGRIVIEKGQPASGIRWTGPFPRIDYEVALEAMRVEGDDFFCAITFPIEKTALTLVVGGWGGTTVGLSSIDGEPAVENETASYQQFELNRWYRIRLRVARTKIEAWIDDRLLIDLPTADRELSLYWEMEPCLPFGVATWYTTGALKTIRVRPIPGKGN